MSSQKSSVLLVVLSFLAVYFIWGSTFFFIEKGVKYFPPMVLGGIRFLTAGAIMMSFLFLKKEKIWDKNTVIGAAISGILMLFIGNGSVVWTEQFLPSSFVAIFTASSPLWFLLLDYRSWKENFSNVYTLGGVVFGLIGVVALFYEKLSGDMSLESFYPILVILIGNLGWIIGSLYTKYRSNSHSATVSSAWQILSAGVVFFIISISDQSLFNTNWAIIPLDGWFSLSYLIVFGSIIAYSAYVYLLKVKSATQVSSYAYVNPVVAVMLGVFINNDQLTSLQYLGLVIIISSVLIINLLKMKKERSTFL